MKDNYYYFFSLNSYLSKADTHYIEGRFLWYQYAFDGACNLLWLSIEQMIKLHIIQKRILDQSLENITYKKKGTKEIIEYNPQEKDIRKIHKLLDGTSFSINSRHQLDNLLELLLNETNQDISKYYDSLGKVKEFYDRRYVKDEGTSINPKIIDNIDELYFQLRGNLSQDIPSSLIDEISMRKKFKIVNSLSYFDYAFFENKYFSSRKHPVIYQMLPNEIVIQNDGINDSQLSQEFVKKLRNSGQVIMMQMMNAKMI